MQQDDLPPQFQESNVQPEALPLFEEMPPPDAMADLPPDEPPPRPSEPFLRRS